MYDDPNSSLETLLKMQSNTQSLANYIYTCWAKETGAVLRPDMIWFAYARN